MSKKSRRRSSRQVASQAARPTSAQPNRATEFNPDYSTTKRELRRIGLLAGTFFIILIVLAIFQNQILSVFMK